jgi:hypothetical protein
MLLILGGRTLHVTKIQPSRHEASTLPAPTIPPEHYVQAVQTESTDVDLEAIVGMLHRG